MRHPISRRLADIALVLAVAAAATATLGLRPGAGTPAGPAKPGTTLEPVAFQRPVQGPPATLEGGVAWLNVAGPIHMRDLKGKVVLLDFWTYCCINCHHVLPDLEYLEQKFPDELVVIGVHSAKFDAEKDTENIRKKVAEYRIKHPVINDANQVLWNEYGVNSWPTLVLIDANGRVFGKLAGEGHRDTLERAITRLVEQHRSKGELDTTPLHFPAEVYRTPEGPLLFPGKVLADGPSKRLFIADTGHNRIVVTGLDGVHQATIGSGAAGWQDGPFDKAQFNRPQGMCLLDGVLYVADVESHAIRACDLESKTVTTVAGTGQQVYKRSGTFPARETGLNSPWDVLPVPGARALFVAMAGPHQIWRLDLEKGTIGVWAGTGKEDINDGPAAEAAFAQPSGLATDGKFLYVADSEGSAVRAVALERPHRVVTIAGTHDLPLGQSLFAFGDQDGRGNRARLQHCLGVSYSDGKLYVADTYNNKIKVITLAGQEVKTLAGTRQAGELDNPPQFNQPGGLSVLGNNLYVADTNNHKVRKLSLSSRSVETLRLQGVEDPRPPATKPRFPNPIVVEVPPVEVAPGREFKLDVTVALPEGFKVNPDAPMPVLLETPEAPASLGPGVSPTGLRLDPPRDKFEVDVPLARPASAGQSLALRLSVSVFECKEGGAGFCRVKNYVFKVPVNFAAGGPSVVALTTADARPKEKEEEAKAEASGSGR